MVELAVGIVADGDVVKVGFGLGELGEFREVENVGVELFQLNCG